MSFAVYETEDLLPEGKKLSLETTFVKAMVQPNSAVMDSLAQMQPISETCKVFVAKGFFGENLKQAAQASTPVKKAKATKQ